MYTGKDLPRIMEHPEEISLFKGGQVHEGRVSALSGLKGIPAASEEIDVARGIALARETGKGTLHPPQQRRSGRAYQAGEKRRP